MTAKRALTQYTLIISNNNNNSPTFLSLETVTKNWSSCDHAHAHTIREWTAVFLSAKATLRKIGAEKNAKQNNANSMEVVCGYTMCFFNAIFCLGFFRNTSAYLSDNHFHIF